MSDYRPVDLTQYPVLLQNYANYKIVIQGRARSTVEDYLSDLMLICRVHRKLREGLPDDPSEISVDPDLSFFESISREDIYNVFSFLTTERGNKAGTRARKLSALKSFYKYLTVTERMTEHNPVSEIDSPKIPQRLPKYLTLDECVQLLDTVRNDTESATKERDFAMIMLFLNCGMRLSELVGINTTDIDREMKTLRLIGKGNKERVIYLNDACREALNAYFPVRSRQAEHLDPKDRRALFLSSRRNQRISQKTVQFVVYKYLDRAGFGNRKLSTHKLRHTAATLMYQNGGVDIRVLKDILGHEQLNTTQIYTHVSDASMQQAAENNPLS
ncbi:MAG: tyrosine recombinase XerC, partial [Clostridia bacterium]|nr:tyrosine recombinase XerC [Clostridia bacterium]